MQLPLFELHPRIAREHPVAGLAQAATAVEPLRGSDGVHLKRDDLTATDYGGNKVRKLDFLLAAARSRGQRTVIAFGYAGSNFVAATAWHGRKLGLHTLAGLLPQAPADYIVDNLSVALASGAELFVRGGDGTLLAEAVARSMVALVRDRRPPAWIPPGGSNALGALGFVNAALELKQQVDAGALPMPRSIVLPFSSMGTVAGLAMGLHLAGMPTRITAVQVVDEDRAGASKLAAMLDRLSALLRKLDVPAPESATLAARVDIRTEFFGGEYGRADAGVKAAMQRFADASGARVDSAYSGKGLACLYADLDADRLPRPALYWHTLSRSARPAGLARADREQAPEALRQYWDAAIPPG